MTVTKRKPKPITAHPMFPVVTALWFAAFLSLGSFAVAPALLEGPVVALGIPKILPAAQPPLGFTVRALVAIVMMGVGGLTGFLIGRRLAGAKQDAPLRNRAFGRAEATDAVLVQSSSVKPANHRRPLNPIEDLGEPSVVGEFTLTNELSADSTAPFAEPAPAIVETARLPWDDDFGADQLDVEHDAARSVEQAADVRALERLFSDAVAVEPESFNQGSHDDSHSQFAAPDEAVPAEFGPVDAVADEAQFAVSPAIEEAAATIAPPTKAPLLQASAAAALPLARMPLDELGLVQLTERLALAIGERNARAAAISQPAMMPYAVPAAKPVASSALNEAAPEDGADFAAPVAATTFASAPAIARFQSASVDVEAPAEVAEISTERVVQLRPAALQPFVPESDAFDEDDVPGLDRFLRAPASVPTFTPAAEDLGDQALDDEDEDVAVWDEGDDSDATDATEVRYPSLLDMGAGSHRAHALRLSHDDDDEDGEAAADELEPIVVFPGQSSPLHSVPRPFDGPLTGAVPAATVQSPIVAVAGSPLAAPGRAAPSSQIDSPVEPASSTDGVATDAEEADRALRAALATLQRMTAQG